MTSAAILCVAVLLDVALSWPSGLYRRIGHPVTWIGGLIGWLDQRLNHGSGRRRRCAGAATVGVILTATVLPAALAQALLPDGWLGIVIGGVLAWPLLAVRSMYDHVVAVATPLAAGQIDEARSAVAMIVGRDPTRLDEAGLARAALESLAENTSDGIVAPLFWGVVAGLPGIVAYKAINTLDSMIGHKTDRYADFGWAAARIDDLVNLLPARLTGALFCVVTLHCRRSARTMLRDASRHRSPNAGWPEAALAGALDVRLSGPRVYGDRVADEPWLNASAEDPTAGALLRGIVLYSRVMALCALLLAGLATL